ncbi:putative DNA helicase [Talaromyces proteolyticus]|uniref:ATP-dependent DNA helicase CHL1 n=1 Tax=Talaromyces proteolyticus TaxID=1131652 RepID=A0AAD4KHZ5_9EURO|nr:putative DNA helicase [Talaromyces proteolyticus]KAH8688867.1 putative DNA helicase [Talaromyces proteolyticus]
MDNVEPRQKFYHPYSPYDIQLEFMRALYECIETGKVGIFESPTGTVRAIYFLVQTPKSVKWHNASCFTRLRGKSLSLICGSLTWLRDHKRKAFDSTIAQSSADDDEPDWMLEYSKQEKTQAVTKKWRELEERLAKIRKEKERAEISYDHRRARKKQKTDSSAPSTSLDESFFELDEYESDAETSKNPSGHKFGDVEGLSASTVALLERFKGHALGRKGEEDETDNQTKIFYCSRTHSQLSQFAQELRRVNIPSSLPAPKGETGECTELEETVKHLSLGSRKQLCINPKVAALGDSIAINERCMELQQPGTAPEKKCAYLPSKETEDVASDFRDRALATVQDIEDIGQLGKQLSICPYYATRPVVKQSEIITLPYQLLLQRSAREALDLSLKDHVVIIDEAHNLMDTISGIHSVSVTLQQLQTALMQLTTYARKFQTRLKGKNRVYVTQLIRLINSLAENLKSLSQKHSTSEAIVQYSELVAGKGVDQINTYKLSRYLQESKLARKVDGYVEHTSQQKGGQQREKTAMPVLFQVQSFILSLMNPSSEGRLFFSKADDEVHLKYLLLDPTNHFREIVDEARAVILAGGTMSPMSDYADYLFSYVQPERLDTFSFGHVIPSSNLTARVLSTGSPGSDFNFTFDRRNSETMVTDLGRTIASLCGVIPDGVVAFFPSYDYLNHVLDSWRKTPKNGREPSIFSLIEKNKPIFYESQRKENAASDIFQQYSAKIESGSGGLLLSVVGGRLSEGINFSDKLGRGVIIVGLPFPNIHSAVWKAKISHIENRAYEKSQGTDSARQIASKAAGRDFYENSCMRAVNQCIGRAIRHRNDYAAIVMIDRRYEGDRIQRKLPTWIRQSLVTRANAKTLRNTQDDLAVFFRGHSSRKAL